MNKGYTTYRDVNVDTADQGKLILICYDVAIRNCKMAMAVFENHVQFSQRTKHLVKAQDAIYELMGALKMDVGDIAKNLYRIYEYLIYRLVQANVKNERSQVEEVVRHLESLRDAWSQAIAKLRRETAPASCESVGMRNVMLSA